MNCTALPGNEYGGSATYVQTGSNPDNMGTLVSSDGTIHLDEASNFDPAQFNDSLDINLTLANSAQVSPGNTTTPVVWATQNGAGVTITVPPGGNSDEFQIVTSDGFTTGLRESLTRYMTRVQNVGATCEPSIMDGPTKARQGGLFFS